MSDKKYKLLCSKKLLNNHLIKVGGVKEKSG